ncbi:MAG TPA: ABC transporter ATP-binding protein [Bacillota bacterium]|nr:ABC transporter ATP-binding protein [Bacillota bacterium]
MSDAILEVNDLRVSFDTYAGEVQAVRGVSFCLDENETLAIVGESGCGKTVTVQTIMRLNPEPPARIKTGSIIYKGRDLTRLNDKQMETYRGAEFAMIFQDPMTSLNPTMRIGDQIAEGIIKHTGCSRQQAMDKTLSILMLCRIPDPEQNVKRYPHTFSGGMRQRIMIAIALACNPCILLADEPTTALDVTMQAQILELMNELKVRRGMSIILITHDLAVVARMADRVAVMYAGQIVETGLVDDVFYTPKHPYTWGLLGSIPSLNSIKKGGRDELMSIPGTPPDLLAPPPGCSFGPRCEYRMPVCRKITPRETQFGNNHTTFCWLHDSRAPHVEWKGVTGSIVEQHSFGS